MSRFVATSVLAIAVAVSLASASHAELAPWDQAKVTALAKQLTDATDALYSTFYKQPVPQFGAGQSNDYRRLKQQVRRIQTEARELSKALAKGDGREDTQDIYDNLMQLVRDARQSVQGVFTVKDVQDQASKVRQLLNQIAPYYDPDAQPLQPSMR